MNTKGISIWFKKHPFTAICAALCIVLLGVYFFRQDAVPESEMLLADRTAESRRLKANIANAMSLKEHVVALQEATRKVDLRLVRGADLAKNQQYFYKMEEDTGVKLMDLRPGGSANAANKPAAGGTKKHYASVPYSCAVQGTYTQLLAFLRKLEEGEHFPRIISANVALSGGSAGDDGASTDPVISLSLNLEFLGQS